MVPKLPPLPAAQHRPAAMSPAAVPPARRVHRIHPARPVEWEEWAEWAEWRVLEEWAEWAGQGGWRVLEVLAELLCSFANQARQWLVILDLRELKISVFAKAACKHAMPKVQRMDLA